MHLKKALLTMKKTIFMKALQKLIACINKKGMVVIGGDLNGHVEKQVDGYAVFIWNTEGEHILEVGTALDMIVRNTWFKKSDKTWWWNKDVDQAIKWKQQLWK